MGRRVQFVIQNVNYALGVDHVIASSVIQDTFELCQQIMKNVVLLTAMQIKQQTKDKFHQEIFGQIQYGQNVDGAMKDVLVVGIIQMEPALVVR